MILILSWLTIVKRVSAMKYLFKSVYLRVIVHPLAFLVLLLGYHRKM